MVTVLQPGHESALTFIPLSSRGIIDKFTGICVHFKQEDKRIRLVTYSCIIIISLY